MRAGGIVAVGSAGNEDEVVRVREDGEVKKGGRFWLVRVWIAAVMWMFSRQERATGREDIREYRLGLSPLGWDGRDSRLMSRRWGPLIVPLRKRLKLRCRYTEFVREYMVIGLLKHSRYELEWISICVHQDYNEYM